MLSCSMPLAEQFSSGSCHILVLKLMVALDLVANSGDESGRLAELVPGLGPLGLQCLQCGLAPRENDTELAWADDVPFFVVDVFGRWVLLWVDRLEHCLLNFGMCAPYCVDRVH